MGCLVLALSEVERAAVGRLARKIVKFRPECARLSAYYEGTQRLQHLGLAVPEELRRFETVLNVPRMAVDEVERRLDVRSLALPGEEKPSKDLLDIWEYNDMPETTTLAVKDSLIYGRGFLSLGGNPADPNMPLIRAEYAPDVAVELDPRTRQIVWALREYRDENNSRVAATLYSPTSIVWLVRGKSEWVEEARAPHGLGRVPMVMLRNRPRTGGEFEYGTSEMADVIGLTDGIARTITNMQVAAEANAIPQKYVVGAAPSDFINKNGEPIPVWQSYFTAVWAITNKDAKPGTFTAASLDNFHNTVNHMFKWAAAILGLPLRYAAQDTVQPATEGAIVADESRLIKNCERKQVVFGNAIGSLMGMAYEVKNGVQTSPTQVAVQWINPATPTFAQRADATQKLAGGIQILSREGAWDEMGWTPARMEIERDRFEREQFDPTLQRLGEKIDSLSAGADGSDYE